MEATWSFTVSVTLQGMLPLKPKVVVNLKSDSAVDVYLPPTDSMDTWSPNAARDYVSSLQQALEMALTKTNEVRAALGRFMEQKK